MADLETLRRTFGKLLLSWRRIHPVGRRVILYASGSLALYLIVMRKGSKRTNRLESGKKKSVGVNKAFFTQMRRILPHLFPSLICRETGLMILHTSCLVARTVASVWLATMDGRIVKALVTKKGGKFLRLLAIWLAVAAPISFLNALIKFLKESLALSFRSRLTKLAHESYCSGLTYYQVQQLDSRLLNPEQCLTADIANFSSSLATLYSDLAKPSLDVAIYNYQL